ncbi:MAG TPA: phosphoenolpyruvate--protein phosphotransferase [Pyrinomonadaceae bacterium]|nr:phosphoenolpyruvate--protein phosphotransferase [Pyrinomonadaceae bacterium]HMP64948.1 phosphoenolpyruvate--protein phosphotransferase [Pyrinomonadaceae bacterium]
MPNETNGSKNNEDKPRPEIRLKAKAVSRGRAAGHVVCLAGRNRQYFRHHIKADGVSREIQRVENAFRLAQEQLARLAKPLSGKGQTIGATIFETHLLMLEGSSLLPKIAEMIQTEQINAEWAVQVVFDEHVTQYKGIDDEHIREKYLDIEDISERIMSLLGRGNDSLGLEEGSVIVARELRPSTVVELHRYNPRALITEHGGWTSHSFILARELNIPAVTGLRKALRRLRSGDRVIVDGFEGNVILNPTSETEENLAQPPLGVGSQAVSTIPIENVIETLDGRRVEIMVNADLPLLPAEHQSGSEFSIGLFRTEYLFNRFGGFPSEEQQYDAYRALAEKANKGRVRIRTFDIDVGQLVDKTEDREANPALGLRAIRLGLTYPRELAVQVRAILRAAARRPIDIVLPMVSGVSDIRACRELIEAEHEELRSKGVETGEPQIGAMIEIPATVLVIDDVLEEVDFVCLGTNDLTQYILAADRDNETIADWFRTLHPAVIKAILSVLSAGRKHKKNVIVCGEMAGSPFYLPVLIGAGAEYLSMNANSIARVAAMIRGIAFGETAELMGRILSLKTADEVEREVRATIARSWPHLFPDDLIR